MLQDGILEAIDNLIPVHLLLSNGDKIVLKIEDVTINTPSVPPGTVGVRNHKIYPSECRQRAATYTGKLTAKIGWSVNGNPQESILRDLGEIPIMIKARLFIYLLIYLYPIDMLQFNSRTPAI